MCVVRALDDPDDVVLSNHRNHGHFLTYSGDVRRLWSRKSWAARRVSAAGIGGSQHLAFRHFHSNGVQAGMTAIGAGLALARKMRGSSCAWSRAYRRWHARRGPAVREPESRVGVAGSGAVRRRKQRHRADDADRPTRSADRLTHAARRSGCAPGDLDDAAGFLASRRAVVQHGRARPRGPGFSSSTRRVWARTARATTCATRRIVDAIRQRDPLRAARRNGSMRRTRAEIEARNQRMFRPTCWSARQPRPSPVRGAGRHIFRAARSAISRGARTRRAPAGTCARRSTRRCAACSKLARM